MFDSEGVTPAIRTVKLGSALGAEFKNNKTEGKALTNGLLVLEEVISGVAKCVGCVCGYANTRSAVEFRVLQRREGKKAMEGETRGKAALSK